MEVDRVRALFDLDPDLAYLDHGAFGAVPRSVSAHQQALARLVERDPHRFHRVELAERVAQVREQVAAELGTDPAATVLVANVSEATSTVLAALALGPGDELLISDHTYGSVRMAVEALALRSGAPVVTARFALDADDETVVEAYRRCVGDSTVLAVVDQITSPTAMVLPVARVAEAVRRRAPDAVVLADAAHVPGTLPTDVAGLGVDVWVGNLHKWMFTPRGAAALWFAPRWRDRLRPLVSSWAAQAPFPASYDRRGTVDVSGWLSVPAGFEVWHALGGWQQVARAGALVHHGQALLADALGTAVPTGHTPAPTMRVVPLPESLVTDAEAADALYRRLAAHGIVVAVVWHAGAAHLRVAAAPYNTLEDYRRLVRALTG